MKKVYAQFSPSMTAQQYDQLMKELEAAGKGKPPGRPYHVAAQQDNNCFVTDVWESEKALNEFSKTLLPILIKIGVTPAQPTIFPVHNIID